VIQGFEASSKKDRDRTAMISALHQHWPEYLMEAAGLGLFMIAAGVFGTLLEYTHSPPFTRRSPTR
jgi:hypothetical protein